MVVNNLHKKNVLNNFRRDEIDSEDDVDLENSRMNEIQTNVGKHSWQYTVQLNLITFYDEDSDIHPNNEHQNWKGTRYLTLYKNVISILNKLTWSTLHQLVDEFEKLPVENKECLKNIANIVAFKAFDEPSFGNLYVAFCNICDITVGSQNGSGSSYESSLKTCVIKVCQKFFEKHCLNDTETITLSIEDEQIQKRLKMRTIGCIRFIGEMLNHNVLSSHVVNYCLITLMSKTKETSLEYFCHLLKIAGKNLSEKINMDHIFKHLMYLMSDEMRSKISPRIRFMVQDVVEVLIPQSISNQADENTTLDYPL